MSETTNGKVVHSFLDKHRPTCPGCGHLLTAQDRCSECGRHLSLVLEAGRPYSIPFLYAFTPWLFLLGTGVFSWFSWGAVLAKGGLGPVWSARSQVHSAGGFILILATELTLLFSPFIVLILWPNRRQIQDWSFKLVFFIGLIPLLAYGFRLFSSTGLFAA